MAQSSLPYSRQYKYQLKMRSEGRCIKCGKKAWRKGSPYCTAHKEYQTMWAKAYKEAKKMK